MKYDTAGDPMSGLKWSRKTPGKIAKELRSIEIKVSGKTVGRLLKAMRYSLKTNQKKISNGGVKQTKKEREKRDKQFMYIGQQRESFSKRQEPVISVDSKKKEKIGNFTNSGSTYARKAYHTNDHDFASYALGKFIPYGIYDTLSNDGSVFAGTSFDTPLFAVESIEKWWKYEGQKRYPKVKNIYILADCGGSNGYRSRVWKYEIQRKLCDVHGLSVTVSHYPPGASKWNPIEHRLFSEISKNWQGEPLLSYEKALKFIRTTKTSTGLKVKAYMVKKKYEKNQTVSDKELSRLSISKHAIMPEWNYTITPSNL